MSKHDGRWCPVCKVDMVPWHGALVCPACDLIDLGADRG